MAPGKADVARPKHELKGFTKVFLKAGESKTVTIDLDERAFAYWSEKYNDWHVEAGCVCSIESGPCERVDVFHVSGRFWSTSACGEKRTPARPAWTSFPS